MAKSLKQIIEIVEAEEVNLRHLDAPKTVDKDLKEIDLLLECKKGIKEFLIDFFYWHNKINQYNGYKGQNDRRDKYKGTYQQKKSIKDSPYLCVAGTRRSIGDLFRIAIVYYSKDITLLEVMEAMYTIVQQELKVSCKETTNYFTMYQSICSTIHKRVFTTYEGSSRTNYKFNSGCHGYTQTSDLTEEFFILGVDYDLLFNTEEGKAFMTNIKEKRKAPIREVVDLERLDELVFAKLKQMKLEFA